MENGKLNGKVAVVTGASKGIGAGIAKHLAAEGAAVVVNYASSKDGADKVDDEISKRGGKAIAVQGDVAKKKDIEDLFAEAKKAFGKIDILVNNAGVYDFKPLEEVMETEGFHAIGIPGSDFERQMVAQTPLGRIGQPRDVAPVVAFLASSEAEWITGETIRVAGGFR